MFSAKNTHDLRSVQFCCLDIVLPAPWFPSSLPNTASYPVFRCHRDSWTRGRLALVQEAVRCPLSLSVSLLGFIPVVLCKVIQATFEKCVFKGCGNVKPLDFLVLTPYSTISSEYAWARSKITASCCDEIGSFVVDYDATNFQNVVSSCNECFCTNALSIQSVSFVALLSWQVGFANGSPSGYRSTTYSRRPT